MKSKKYELLIDIYKGILNNQLIEFTTEDAGKCELEFNLLEDRITPYDLTGCLLRMVIQGQQQDCTIVEASGGKAKITLLQSMFTTPGFVVAELQIYDATNQTLRLTTPRFKYNVRKSLMDDNAVEADPNFSILQNMIINVTNADETATQALAKANEAVTKSNQAVTTIDNQVAKVDQAVLDANEALERAGNVVTQDELDVVIAETNEKIDGHVTLDNLPYTNFIFNGRKVEQDGLVTNRTYTGYEATTFFPNDSNFTLVAKFIVHAEDGGILGNCPTSSLSSGFRLYTHAAKNLYFGNNGVSSVEKINTQDLHAGVEYTVVIKKMSIANYNIFLFQGTNLLTQKNIRKNYQADVNTALSIKGYGAGQGSSIKTDVSILIYNRPLTPQEIQHDIQVLNNSESIDSISITDKDGASKNFILATDSDHTTMANGFNQEQAYTGILKTMGKEFISADGSPIEVNNGVEYGKVISGEIQGQTVKEIIGAGDFSKGVQGWYNVGNFTSVIEGNTWVQTSAGTVQHKIRKPLPKNTFIKGNKYYVSVEVCLEGIDSTAAIRIYGKDYVAIGSVVKSVPTGKFVRISGIMEYTSSVVDDSEQSIQIDTAQSSVVGSKMKVRNIIALDVTGTTHTKDELDAVITKAIPFGLNSTQAIINNNGQSYPIWMPLIIGETVVQKRIKGSTGEWTTIPSDEERNTITYEYRLSSLVSTI